MFNYTRIKQLCNSALNQYFLNGYTKNIIYKKLINTEFDPSVGSNINTYEEYEIKVVDRDISLEILGSSSVLKAIGYNAGELLYIVRYNDMPRNPLDKQILKDIIVDNGTEFKIKKAKTVFDILVYLQV